MPNPSSFCFSILNLLFRCRYREIAKHDNAEKSHGIRNKRSRHKAVKTESGGKCRNYNEKFDTVNSFYKELPLFSVEFEKNYKKDSRDKVEYLPKYRRRQNGGSSLKK